MSDAEQNTTPKKRAAWMKGFLAALRDTANVRLACDAVGIARTTAYDRRNSDERFAADWERTLEEAADLLEEEARRRAHAGWDEPVFGRLPGKDAGEGEIGAVRKYSDTLLIFLLKGARPEKYRERSDVRHSGKIDIGKLSDDELRAIAENQS